MYTSGADGVEDVDREAPGVAARLLALVSAMDDASLTERARELAGEISAAEANLAAVLAELERRQVHSAWECTTIERFASWHCQLSPSRTTGLATVGRALEELPVLAEAVADGTLGFDKAKSIARVAAPDTEGALVEMARHATVAQTQRICGAWRKVERDAAATDGDSEAAADEPRPTVVVVRDVDGLLLTARFDHVRGELVLAAIEREAKAARTEREAAAPADPADANDRDGVPACAEDRPAERLEPAEWRAEGLLRLARRPADDPSDGLQPSGFDTTVVVHVGIDTLRGPDTGHPAPSARPGRDGMAELEPAGVRIRRDVARWLACDAGLLTVIEDEDGNPLHLGRRQRSVPASLRRAVMARHRTCAWPGCVATAVQLHHVHHRAHGGHDDVENLAPECPAHHRAVHVHGIRVSLEPDGRFRHWRRDGSEVLAAPPPGPRPTADALTAPAALAHQRLGFGGADGATARMPLWRGDPLHLNDCIDALVSRRAHALRRTVPSGAPPPG